MSCSIDRMQGSAPAGIDPDSLPAIEPSSTAWLAAVMADFPAFLIDHASCEKKASGMALNVAAHYPDKPVLVRAMTDLAVEELSHWREVMRVLIDHGIRTGPDDRDPYVKALQALIRKGPRLYLMDRLLVAALMERRGAERFARIAAALEPRHPFVSLAPLYRALATSESRHWTLFIELAAMEFDANELTARFLDLHAGEQTIVDRLPPTPRLH